MAPVAPVLNTLLLTLVFKFELNIEVLLESRMSDGKVFQIVGAATENHRAPVLVLDRGTSRTP